MLRNIAIVGAGGFGREIALLISQINAQKEVWKLVGFYDDHPDLQGKNYAGLPVLGTTDALNRVEKQLSVVIAVGSPQVKRKIFQKLLNPNLRFPTLIHPGAIFGGGTEFGIGNIICAGTILTVNNVLGDFVTINLGCTVGHDTRIGAFSSVMPGVCISGEVLIEEGVYIGTGANIINQVEIGEESIIGAGALVNKSSPGFCTLVGVPARIIRIFKPTY